MYRRFEATGGQVKGVLWYQGEAEANAKLEPIFREKFVGLIEAIRRDFNTLDLPFYYKLGEGEMDAVISVLQQLDREGVAP